MASSLPLHHACLDRDRYVALERVISDELRSHTDGRHAPEVEIAVYVLNCMLDVGRSNSVRIA